MENRRAVLLLSGGIDSTTLLAKLIHEGYDVFALSFDYGQKHGIELEFARANAKKYNVSLHKTVTLNREMFESSALVSQNIKVSSVHEEQIPKGEVNAYVPFRNLIFISIALAWAENLGVQELFMGFNKDDFENFWDCRGSFIDNLNQAIKFSGDFKVKAPFSQLTKKEVVMLARKLDVDICHTLTCYQPKGTVECGECLSCIVKKKSISL